MKDKKPSDPYNLVYQEAEHLLAEDALVAALEVVIKQAEEKVLGRDK